MNTRLFLRSFAGGEISPEMFGRIDDVKFQSGAARVLNFISLPHGPVKNRPGLRYVNTTKDSGAKKSRVLPFTFSAEDTRIIELGAGYFRVYNNGVREMAVGAPWIAQRNAYVYTAASSPYTTSAILSEFSTVDGDLTTGTDTFTKVGHTFQNGDAVGVVSTAAYPTTSPAGLMTGTQTFYVVGRTATTFQISQTLGGAPINITGNTGGATLHWAKANLFADMPVALQSVPAASGLTAGQTYYAVVTAPTALSFRQTPGTGGVIITAPGAIAFPGTSHLLKRRYSIGEIVTTGGATYYALVASDGQAAFVPSEWLVQTDGALTIPNDYAEADLFDIKFVQSNDIVTLVHPSYPAAELRRLSATHWQFVPITFAPSLSPPSTVTATGTDPGVFYTIAAVPAATGFGVADMVLTAQTKAGLLTGDTVWCEGFNYPGLGAVPLTDGFYLVGDVSGVTITITETDGVIPVTSIVGPYTANSGRVRRVPLASEVSNSYRVTTLSDDGTESQPSSVATVADNNLFAPEAYNVITWSPVIGARSYRVYKLVNGIYGFIGEVFADQTLSFKDDNISPDLSILLPALDTSLSGDDYPAAVGYFQQRRVFALRQQVWLTRSGTESDLTYSIPLRDDDRISFALASLESNQIKHIVALGDLLVLADSAEYRVTSTDSSVLTPASVMAGPQAYVGAGRAKPALVNNAVVYAAARGGHVRELGFQAAANGFLTGDLSLRAAHLFDGYTIEDMAVSKAPYPIVWAVSSSGALLGMTYVPDQEVSAWHQHSTDGVFESCAVVAEGTEDALYVVVKRTVNGSPVRYIERLAAMRPATSFATSLRDAVFVDSAVTVTNVTPGVVGGFLHLVGKTVSILADGIVLPSQVVSAAGTIRVSASYSTLTAGLPIAAMLQTLPMALQLDGYGQGVRKDVNQVKVRTVESCAFYVGSTMDTLKPSNAYAPSVRGLAQANPVSTGAITVPIPGHWGDDGQVYVTHLHPLPLTIAGITIEVAIGGQ